MPETGAVVALAVELPTGADSAGVWLRDPQADTVRASAMAAAMASVSRVGRHFDFIALWVPFEAAAWLRFSTEQSPRVTERPMRGGVGKRPDGLECLVVLHAGYLDRDDEVVAEEVCPATREDQVDISARFAGNGD